MSTPIDIDRLRELESKATPGPWSWMFCEWMAAHAGDNYYSDATGGCPSGKHDGALIAEMRNALPALRPAL